MRDEALLPLYMSTSQSGPLRQAGKALLGLCMLTLVLTGCSSASKSGTQVVEYDERQSPSRQVTSGYYTVKRGDSLWAIASSHGWEWQELARANRLAPPYNIYPGQTIRFDRATSRNTSTAPQAAAVAPVARETPAKPALNRSPVARQTLNAAPSTTGATAPASTAKPMARTDIKWAWPASGAVISRFAANGSLNKGIDISGEVGQPVMAASDGTVLYAGNGLRGYGELVIIKHSDTYVSAYGHNQRLLVREGQQVKVGQAIAEMGSTGTDRVKLHFEIRRQGKPEDPLQYLPSR